MQALVQWMQKHARVLTTPSTPEGQVAGPSLPEEVEHLHASEAAASEPNYWPVRMQDHSKLLSGHRRLKPWKLLHDQVEDSSPEHACDGVCQGSLLCITHAVAVLSAHCTLLGLGRAEAGGAGVA